MGDPDTYVAHVESSQGDVSNSRFVAEKDAVVPLGSTSTIYGSMAVETSWGLMHGMAHLAIEDAVATDELDGVEHPHSGERLEGWAGQLTAAIVFPRPKAVILARSLTRRGHRVG